MSGADPRDVVMLPPVADDPIFSESLFEEPPSPRSGLGEDPHDFAGLYIRHRWSFQLHARRFLHDQRDIDEVVQEGFLKLFLALPELETELQALAYARRTITNLCIDRYRADQRRPRLVDLETIPLHALPDEDDDDPVVAAEDAAIVREALALLSPLHREALIKREIEEKPLPVIAVELEIPVEQVKHVLHRARRSLRRLLVGTHVEPGVDLDLALVLEANRARAARAARPTGAAVLAVLLVLAGVLGLRSNTPRRVVAVAPSSAPVDGLIPAPGAAPSVPSGGHLVTTPVAPPSAPQDASPRTRHPGRHAINVPAAPAKPAVTSPKPPARGGSIPPVVTPEPPALFVVTGVGASGHARVSDQQRALRAAGTTSSSTLSAPTATGTYALRQAYTFDATGSLVGVEVSESVPTEDGATVTTVLRGGQTTSTIAADGTVHVATIGSAAPADGGTSLDRPRTLALSVVLDPDRVRVLAADVQVVGGVPIGVGAATGPAPVRAPGAASAFASEQPLGPQDPAVAIVATQLVAVIAQDQGLR